MTQLILNVPLRFQACSLEFQTSPFWTRPYELRVNENLRVSTSMPDACWNGGQLDVEATQVRGNDTRKLCWCYAEAN